MSWAAVDDVLPLLAADLGIPSDRLDQSWSGRLELAIPQARREIETALNERSYSPTLIANCDWLFDEHRELSLVFALEKGASLTGYDVSTIQARITRIQTRLRTVPIYIGGQPVWPDRTTPTGQSTTAAGGMLAVANEALGINCPPWLRRIDPNEGY